MFLFIQLRTDLAKSLSNTEALTLDSLQQTALAYKVITQETDELSDECQVIETVELIIMLH